MNERLFRTQFNQMETTEKQALMESLAARYDMTFLGLHKHRKSSAGHGDRPKNPRKSKTEGGSLRPSQQ